MTDGCPNAICILNGCRILFQTGIELFKCEFFKRVDVCLFTRGPFRQMRNEKAMLFDDVDVAFKVFVECLGQLGQCNLHVRCQQLASKRFQLTTDLMPLRPNLQRNFWIGILRRIWKTARRFFKFLPQRLNVLEKGIWRGTQSL